MAGIYIHIPFCKQKCNYCNFYSIVSLKYKDRFIKALLLEINSQKNYLKNKTVNTIYFGGGTPSILSIADINLIIKALNNTYKIATDTEITLEANPDNLTEKYLNDLKNYTDINRLSIGIQSFFNDDLKYLNRIHSSNQAQNSIENSLKLGFDNITIDLIYGIPTLNTDKWKENLKIFFDYNIPHLSAYSLTVEPKTALEVNIKKKKLQNIDELQSIAHFKILLEQSQNFNFINYEISNFAKKGFYSKHNSNYWLGKYYLGIGPSAHSYNKISRQWNVSNIKKYCETNDKIEEIELLSKSQQFNEYVLTSIRTTWGCDTTYIKQNFGDKYYNHFINNTILPIAEKNIIKINNNYTLSNNGKLFADGIAAELFM